MALTGGDAARELARLCPTSEALATALLAWAQRNAGPSTGSLEGRLVPIADLMRWPVTVERLKLRDQSHFLVSDHATPWYALYSPVE